MEKINCQRKYPPFASLTSSQNPQQPGYLDPTKACIYWDWNTNTKKTEFFVGKCIDNPQQPFEYKYGTYQVCGGIPTWGSIKFH